MEGKCAEDGESALYRTQHDSTSESLSTTLLLALESLPSFDGESDENRLYEHVDADALDALFRSTDRVARSEGFVTFPIGEYEVTVHADGEIVIQQ